MHEFKAWQIEYGYDKTRYEELVYETDLTEHMDKNDHENDHPGWFSFIKVLPSTQKPFRERLCNISRL